MKKLTDIVWPEIARAIEERLASIDQGVAVIEAAVLLEAGWDRMCDEVRAFWYLYPFQNAAQTHFSLVCTHASHLPLKVWVLTSNEENVKKRLLQRGLSEPEIQKRIASQLSTWERSLRATRVIPNDGSLEGRKSFGFGPAIHTQGFSAGGLFFSQTHIPLSLPPSADLSGVLRQAWDAMQVVRVDLLPASPTSASSSTK